MTRNPPNNLARYPVGAELDLEPNRNILIVPERTAERLSDKEYVDYHEYRKAFLTWLLQFGKNPKKAEGYAPQTVVNTGYRASAFDRWTWNKHDSYVAPPSEDDAREYLREIALDDTSNSTKGKKLEMLRRYSKWLSDQRGRPEWEFEWEFSSSGGNHQPRDFLSTEERRLVRQAALQIDGTPEYGIEKALQNAEEGSWKFTSIVWASLDAGLRPVEVGDATTGWVDVDNAVLRIPREDSAKNEGNWTVSLTERTATALEHWLDERAEHPRYKDTNQLWLTRRGNRYGSNELRRIMHRLCEIAGIDTDERQMSWYTIRHSVGTYMTRERDLAAAKAQLRHQNPQTTMKYDQVPVEERRNALDKMG